MTERYAVSATVDIVIEIDGESAEKVIGLIAQAFHISKPIDPMANTTIKIGDKDAVIKTAIIHDWDVLDMEAEIV